MLGLVDLALISFNRFMNSELNDAGGGQPSLGCGAEDTFLPFFAGGGGAGGDDSDSKITAPGRGVDAGCLALRRLKYDFEALVNATVLAPQSNSDFTHKRLRRSSRAWGLIERDETGSGRAVIATEREKRMASVRVLGCGRERGGGSHTRDEGNKITS